ncbi:MAG: glycoside hydrolase family 99-like domain-containing protein [Acidisphaera sp.]|nr:glycoside hydrolase family 99-like domain-containing protein [Acidisphaera sp.]
MEVTSRRTKSEGGFSSNSEEADDADDLGLSSPIRQATRDRCVLDSVFLDEDYLFKGFGLRRAQRREFLETYDKLPIQERPNLSPFFDTRWYLTINGDVRTAGLDAFSHFCWGGIKEMRSPHPLVWPGFVLPVGSEFQDCSEPLAALREALENNTRAPNSYFELDYYLERCPGAATHPGGALRHFLEAPLIELVIPNRYFDPAWYQERYPDVPRDPRAAFLHFATQGDREKRVPGPAFDPEYYLWNNPDVVQAAVPPLEHFLISGEKEGRRPTSNAAIGLRGPTRQPSHPHPTPGEALPDIAEGRTRYRNLRTLIAERRHARKVAFAEREARPVVVRDINAAIAQLRFPRCKRPRVSIMVPFYNEMKVTVECLTSVMRCKPACGYEIIAADDCSSDEQARLLSKVPGLLHLRQPANVNFLKNCNEAFARLKGEYVLLLNNDAQLCEGAIDELVAALDQDPGLGAVGPKILFPDGLLQEAGCAINRDCTSTMVGLWEDPDADRFGYPRDVHYVSGAVLMFRRSLARERLFDEALAPAYCEDQDLCLDIAAKGFRIRYVPTATAVHHLSVTMANRQQKLRRIHANQQKLSEKWGEQLDAMNRVRTIAFYLPQFHPIAQNDLWWGAGFTEWTNVAKAQPSYAGHYQPHLPADLGFYDLRVADVLRQQAKLADRYDLAGFCLYYYNFGGEPILNGPLETVLRHPDIPFNFCLCWANENWSRRWDGGTNDLLLEQSYDTATLDRLAQDVGKATRDPRYIRVNGAPVLLIYRPLLIPEPGKTVARLRRSVREAGGGELHLVFVESMESVDSGVDPCELGFDAAVEFPPQGSGVRAIDEREVYKPDWDGRRYDYESTALKAVLNRAPGYPRYPAVFPSWDNTARQPLRGSSFDNASPECFQAYAEEKIEECKNFFVGEARLLFVNAWNEWAEGAHLEPDRAYGHRWLEALRHALFRQGCA